MDTNPIPERMYANHGDTELVGDSTTYGHHRSSEAIGGYFGIAWYEYFQDRVTGEKYRVYCYDGTYRSKGPYKDEDIEEAKRDMPPVKKKEKKPSFKVTIGELIWEKMRDRNNG